MGRSRISVVDGKESIRNAMGQMLAAYGYEVELFDSAIAFLNATSAGETGCVVSDVHMPVMDGIELACEIQKRNLNVPIILISGDANVSSAVAGIKAGAQDFIEWPVEDVKLIAAINRALARKFERHEATQALLAAEQQFARLTPREVQVFDLIAQGRKSPAIAQMLGISERTVESYRGQVMEKLQTNTVSALVRLAVRLNRLGP